MRKVITLALFALFISGCALHKSNEESLAEYKTKISEYSCSELNIESEFQNKLIGNYKAAKENHSVLSDVAVVGIMTLGADALVNGESVSGKKNYDERLQKTNNKINLIENIKKEKCHA